MKLRYHNQGAKVHYLFEIIHILLIKNIKNDEKMGEVVDCGLLVFGWYPTEKAVGTVAFLHEEWGLRGNFSCGSRVLYLS